jgi:hypothetical protein
MIDPSFVPMAACRSPGRIAMHVISASAVARSKDFQGRRVVVVIVEVPSN